MPLAAIEQLKRKELKRLDGMIKRKLKVGRGPLCLAPPSLQEITTEAACLVGCDKNSDRSLRCIENLPNILPTN
jgi:hypothetical protein